MSYLKKEFLFRMTILSQVKLPYDPAYSYVDQSVVWLVDRLVGRLEFPK